MSIDVNAANKKNNNKQMNNNTTYKDSPLGKIPSDWEVKNLGEVFKVNAGGDIDKENVSDEITDVFKYPIYANAFKKKGLYGYSDLYKVDYDCITVTGRGEIGGAVARFEKFYPIVRLLILKPQLPLDLVFYENTINFSNIHQESTGVPQLTAPQISSLKLRLPPLPEQIRIAEVLSAWDKAISNVQATIEQVELRNKWLMQELLTGKRRLKGFGGEWKKVGAGEIFKSITIKGFEKEELLSATQDRGIIPRSMLEGRVTMPEGTTSSYKLVEPGDFVISLRSFQGGLEYSYYRGIVSPAYIVLKPKKAINDEFYKHYYKSYEFIGRLATAVIGIRDGKQVSYDDFCVVKIPFPTLEEQTAIAQVLQAADKEVQVLRNKLDKLKEQKKGLMQVLLTGKKRLNVKELAE